METGKPVITGYSIKQQIYASSRTLVYTGARCSDQTPVAIKLMRNLEPSYDEIVQFHNQYIISKDLNIEGIVKPYSFETCKRYALIMELGGISLKQWKSNQPLIHNCLDLTDFFTIAIQIASVLDQLHSNRVIHKDIKPANILINPDTKQIKLIDFSISSLLPREIQELQNPGVLEGTLAYISPEQTGRMNRGIDYRTDFYSLGITFYELLTGKVPFESDDPIELVHYHIAKLIPPVHHINPNIPEILSDIIAKLTAKNAEDRYQSALGLKHDLETCFNQYKHGNISTLHSTFQLGQLDIANRFIIPEKLYGRDAEVKTLLNAFNRISNQTSFKPPLLRGVGGIEIILITGSSGIGKTLVVNEIHKPILEARAYFIKGKYSPIGRNIPFSGLVQAFRSLILQLLSETTTIEKRFRQDILAALGENAQIIIDVIPELERLIGEQPPVVELSGSGAQNRFNLLFEKFIKVFATPDHPLVLFLDDLQWADSSSLKLIQLLATTSKNCNLLLIGAYRDSEVDKGHLLIRTLQEINDTGANINTITLNPLSCESVNQLVADTLNCSTYAAQPLSELVYQKTQGNPFFAAQFLKSLHEEGLIVFDAWEQGWQCDITQIKTRATTDNIVDFMAQQLQKLPTETQNVLQLAACIGNEFDLATLALAYGKSQKETANQLWSALQEGLILPVNRVYKLFDDNLDAKDANCKLNSKFQFLHDRVQQAAYSSEQIQQLTHLKIGRLLLQLLPASEQDNRLFDIVYHLNIGAELLTHQENLQLAQLNLNAGCKARASTAYATALSYFITGIDVLNNIGWQHQYELMLALHNNATESAYLVGDFSQMEALANIVIQKSQSVIDTIAVYEVLIQAYTAQNQLQRAIETGLAILEKLGIKLPQPTKLYVVLSLLHTNLLYTFRKVRDLKKLPKITNPRIIAIQRLIVVISSAAYMASPLLYALLNFKMMRLLLRYGTSEYSSITCSIYGMLLCMLHHDIETGNKFGELALYFLDKFSMKSLQAKVLFSVYTIKVWKYPIEENFPLLLEACQSGLDTGDLEYAAYHAVTYCSNTLHVGRPLSGVLRELAIYREIVCQCNQEITINFMNLLLQLVINLRQNHLSSKLIGEFYNEEQMILIYQRANDKTGLAELYSCKIYLNLLLGDIESAFKYALLTKENQDALLGTYGYSYCVLLSALAYLGIYPNLPKTKQKYFIKQVTHSQKQLKLWAKHSPINFQHKWQLVEAETCRVLGKYTEAIHAYDLAISGAKRGQYLQDEALANELAANFYLAWGKQKIASFYLIEAYNIYQTWGATAKLIDLQQRYPHVFSHLIDTSLNTYGSHLLRRKSDFMTSSTLSQALDWTTFIKASQALSSEIKLDKLLAKLIQVAMENAGANKSVLILPQDNIKSSDGADYSDWLIQASATINDTPKILQSIPINSSPEVPINLINYVSRTQETIVLADAASNLSSNSFTDPYIIEKQPRSILCAPILNQGQLIAILYLENNLVTGAFTENRVQILNLLCSQIAISIENATFYNTLENKVQVRTDELQNALTKLKQTQAQLVQNEKMSSLGQMVAGVAHEINNPVGFIQGNITYVSDYMQDLLQVIKLYDSYYPDKPSELKKLLLDIDVDFISEDFQKILASMESGTERISQIVKSLRNFSRLDEAELKRADIHEGIDNTLMVLRHRLQPQSRRPEITVIKQYNNIPIIECYAAQLNQAFMNIILNAIDAIEESLTTNNQPHQPTITITTQLTSEKYVQISIADNGIGIPEDIKTKLFDPFFTTKPVGKGTGLGLSTSYQTVVDKHNGRLWCESTPEGSRFIIQIPVR